MFGQISSLIPSVVMHLNLQDNSSNKTGDSELLDEGVRRDALSRNVKNEIGELLYFI